LFTRKPVDRLLAEIRRAQEHIYLSPMHDARDARAESGSELSGMLHGLTEFNEQIDITAAGGVVQPRAE